MKKIMILAVTLLLLVSCSPKEKTKFTIGILNWGDHPALNDARDGFIEGLKEHNLDKQVTIIDKNAYEDSSNANIIISQMVTDKVDLIYAIATPAAQAAVNGTKETNIPVIFNAVTDPVSAGLVTSNELPGGNATGVSDAVPLDRQLALIKEFIPNAQKVGVLYNTGEDNSWFQIEAIKDTIDKHDLTLLTKGISSSSDIALATEQLSTDADVLYIITDNMVAKATAQVVSIANEKKVPVFMAEAGQFEHGILASDSISYFNLGKQAANMASDILVNNKTAAEIPVEISENTDLFVSQSVADFLGIVIPESILNRAIIK